jgi:UDP-3-O-[3-hydroxymyristoyl] N-acetylglucosamine deacetylase
MCFMYSATLMHPVALTGRGLISGEACHAELRPAPPGQGITFFCGTARIPAHPASYIEQPNYSALGHDGAYARATEHLLAALWAAGIDTLHIVVDGPELPNMDGSALPQYEAILGGGRVEHGPRPRRTPDSPVQVEDGEASLRYEPWAELFIGYTFSHPELGEQRLRADLTRESAVREILPARSFITAREAQAALAAGVLHNTHAEDALLIVDGVPTQPLRFPDEYARHKVLDLLGDLYVLPFEWCGRIHAVRSGHRLNRELARRLVQVVE